MKALVYHGPNEQAWEEVPDPVIQDATDVIVRVDTTTICGTDLHIMLGDVPAVTPGRILGHEAIGTIVEVGAAVSTLAVGDRVIVSCITSCGSCFYCRKGQASHCETVGGIGWILGHLIDGTQAELVRVPFAQNSVHKLPDTLTDEQALFLSDIIPTGFEVGVRAGVVNPGDNVVCIGAGPVGLSAMLTAHLYGAKRVIAVDLSEFRLEQAKEHFGATHGVDPSKDGWMDEVRELCDGHGADVVMEAVGVPATLGYAFDLVRPYGHIANVGVHGKPVELPIDRMWIENVTITMGLVDASTTPLLLGLVRDGQLDPSPLATHTFALDDIVKAYDVFKNAASENALKVILKR